MALNEPVEPVERLSARALYIYCHMVASGSYMTAEELSEVFKEGRDACQAALNELRSWGLVETEKQRLGGGRFVTVSRLVLPPEPDNRNLKSRFLLQQNLYIAINNIKNSFIANSSSSKQLYDLKNWSAFADNENYGVLNIPVGGKMDDDYYQDQARARELWQKESQEEFEDKKRKAHNKVRASGKNIHGCVAEFASRVDALWGVKPWTQDKTNFRIAYSNARRTHLTNGDIEFIMMDLFFGSMEHIKGINDPDHLWRKFISMFGPLSIQVKNTMLSSDKVEKEDARVTKSMEKLFDV